MKHHRDLFNFIKIFLCFLPKNFYEARYFICAWPITTVFLIVISIHCQNTFAVDVPASITEQSPLPGQLGSYRHIQFNDTDLYATTLNSNYHADIYQQDAGVQALAKSIGELSLTQNFLLAVNGGYYTPQFLPAGLFIYQNKILHPLAKKDPLLTACIGIHKNKKLFLATRRQNCFQAFSAVQVGPVLIQDGDLSHYLSKPHPRVKEFLSAHRRTIIALSTDHQVIVMVTSPTTLLNLAMILKEQPALFGVKKIMTAINSDGGSSTGMYIRFNKAPFYFPEQKNVKTFLFFR